MHPFFSYLDKAWPAGAGILTAAIAFGSMHSDVADLQAAQVAQRSDHDLIMHLDQGQQDMKHDLDSIKQSLDRIEHR